MRSKNVVSIDYTKSPEEFALLRELIGSIIASGRQPITFDLAQYLRAEIQPIPQQVRRYVADLLEKPKSKGRPATESAGLHLHQRYIVLLFQQEYDANKSCGNGKGAREGAIATVSELLKIDPSTLERMIKKHKTTGKK